MNRNPTYYKREKFGSDKTVFMFDSLDSYNRFIDDNDSVAQGNARIGMDEINAKSIRSSIRRQGASWFGTTNANSVLGNLDTYLFNPELDSFLSSFRGQTVNVDVVDIDQQKAIKFTDLEIGIFSYDLASLGLIPVVEYYSGLLDKVVSPNYVIGEKNQDQKTIFYHIYTPFVPMHKVSFELSKNGYYSEILKRNVAKSELVEVVNGNDIYMAFPQRDEIPKHIVEQRQKIDDNGNKKFSSTFKKSFIYIPQVEKPLPRIDIICIVSYPSGVDAQTEMIYNSMPAIALAEKLSNSGINYRLVAAYPKETYGAGTRKKVFGFVTIKKDGEALDKNKIAIFLSDGRNYRNRQFKFSLAMQYDAGYDSNIDPYSISRPLNDEIEVKQTYIDFLKNQDNPEDRMAAENPNSKVILRRVLSEQDARAEYDRIIRLISKI
jgi:hypothetical protein